MDPGRLHALHFGLNDQRLLALIVALTGHTEVAGFSGRVYRLLPGADHELDWHTDLNDPTRLVALSLNLSPSPFAGGALRIRDARTREVMSSVSNTGYGDAILFLISKHLEHCVTPVEGSMPRTSFAGWFRSTTSGDDLGSQLLTESRT